MVSACGSTLVGDWVQFAFCYTVLVYVSFVSSLIFSVIWSWKMSANFYNCFKFFCVWGRDGAEFSVHWSGLLSHAWLHRQNKFLVLWYPQEIIWLCMKYDLLLCLISKLYNTSSAQMPVLCTILVPHIRCCKRSRGFHMWAPTTPFSCPHIVGPTCRSGRLMSRPHVNVAPLVSMRYRS